MNAYQAAATFLSNFSYCQLSEEARQAVKRIVLDSFGCMVAGSRLLPDAGAFETQEGLYTTVGIGRSPHRDIAIALNGSAMVATELDEGHAAAKGHPAAHFFPALLAEAEEKQCDGRAFIAAFAAVYEVVARFGSAVTLRPAVHPHGNWGTIGSAAAVAKLNQLSGVKMAQALLLGASLPVGSAWTAALRGATVRNGYIGASNVLGSLAARMAQAGMESHPQVVASIYESMLGSALDIERMDGEYSGKWLLESNYMKMYACCRFVHGAVDGMLAIRERFEQRVGRPLEPEEIRHIQVETYKSASVLRDARPPNGLAAKFSIPFSLAILLGLGKVEQEQFADGHTQDARLRMTADRVAVEEAEEFTRLLPHTRATRVTLTTIEGKQWREEVRVVTGDPGKPLTDQQLIEKFLVLAAPVLGAKRAEKTVYHVQHLEELQDIREMTALLFPVSV